MHLTKRTRYLIAGVAAVTATGIGVGNAFTAGGLSNTSNDTLIGGTTSVTITGATITNIAYATTGDTIDSVTVTMTGNDIDAKVLRIQFQNNSDANVGTYTCGAISSGVSTCNGSAKITSPNAKTLILTVSET